MKQRLRFAAIAMAVAVPMTILSAGSAQAINIGQEGCTPGYWKNHTENWEEYKPSSQLRFTFRATTGTRFGTMTFHDALSLRGGAGTDGASQILLRAGTAALLNAAHEGIGYPYRRYNGFAIISQVNTALAGGDRAAMLQLATVLDTANNLGCPL